MKEPFDIEPYKAETEIIRMTVEQIRKDFAMFGLDISFPMRMNMVYEELFSQLDAHVSQLLTVNVQKLMALLYQIDIPERNIMEAWEAHPEFTHAQVIAELIIYRELKKVILRNYYKNFKLEDTGTE